MRTQSEDIAFGRTSEERNCSVISAFVGDALTKTSTYHPMDYTNDGNTIFVELKTRRVRHDQYPTALIGKNKVDFCSDPAKTYYFFYCYADGLFYVKYDPELFKTFRVEEDYTRSERSGCSNPSQRCVHIPHTYLLRLEQ